MTDGYMSEAEVHRLAEALPRTAVQFTENGSVAVWRESGLHWLVTGSDLAWGDPVRLVKIFGPYVEIGAQDPPLVAEVERLRADASESFGRGWHAGLAVPVDRAKFSAIWDECLDAIEANELNTAQAREGNPYRDREPSDSSSTNPVKDAS